MACLLSAIMNVQAYSRLRPSSTIRLSCGLWGVTDIVGKLIWGIASWHAGKPPSPNYDIIIQSAVLATVSE